MHLSAALTDVDYFKMPKMSPINWSTSRNKRHTTSGNQLRPPWSIFLFCLCPLAALCQSSWLFEAPQPAFIFIILLSEHWVELQLSPLLLPGLIWPHVFGLDEPMAQWNKPVCLLHKPMFRAYMLWRLYTALKKKEKKSFQLLCG